MTAINIWTTPTASYLLTDRASYSDDGYILQISRKVATTGGMPIAVALNGQVPIDFISALNMALANCDDAEQALSGIPKLLKMLKDTNPNDDVSAFIATWLHGRPCCFYASTTALDGSKAAFDVHRIRYVVSPPVSGISHPQDAGFDPATDGIALIERQRQARDVRGIHRVGGGADLTTVTASGAVTRRLIDWPDRIGRLIHG